MTCLYGDFAPNNTSGSDYLEGGTGNDTLYGGAGNAAGALGVFDLGNDTLDGGAGNDQLYGEGGNDILYAGTGGDFLDGGDGNDTIYADGSFADGYDFLYGSAGDDVYIIDGGNVAFRNDQYDAGYDRLYISASISLSYGGGVNVVEIEEITLTGNGAFNATGNSLDNIIHGNDAGNLLQGLGGLDQLFGNGGNDTLEGGFGYVDILRGGQGDDTYIVNDYDDIAEDASQGHDVVQSSVRWVLGDNFEDLVLTGAANINGFGNGLANQLTGNSGNNYLQGYGDFDVLKGGAGNDFYELGDLVYRGFLGYTFDSVTEGFNAGNDTVRVTATDDPGHPFSTNHYSLGANIEVGIIAGTIAFNLNGNELDNTLTGNDAANALAGNDGNDTLDGNGGLDVLSGGAGNDTYILDDLTFIDDFTG